MTTESPTQFKPITGSSVWNASSFASKADFSFPVTSEVIKEIHDFLAEIKGRSMPLEAITLAKFGRPAMKAMMEKIRDELWDGRGFLILSGLPTVDLAAEEIESYYWLLSLYMGKPVSQSAAGDRLGRVQDETKPGVQASSRGYVTRRMLPLHTDAGDYMGLLSVRTAKSGGLSLGVSLPNIYNIMAEKHPELLERLFRGFHYHRRHEQQGDEPLVTPYKLPILAWAGDRLTGFYVRPSFELAFKELGIEPDPLDIEALDVFDEISWAPENLLKFMMEPGDIYFANNLATLHSRTEFVDYEEPARKRLSLRIWLQREPRTPVPENQIPYRNPSRDLGIDGKVGGKAAAGEYTLAFKRDIA